MKTNGNVQMKRYVSAFFLTFFFTFIANADKLDPIQQINIKVSALKLDISSGDLAIIEIKEILDSEGSPPEFKLYYNQDGLVVAYVNIGHETWWVKYSYYFYPNGLIMKIVEEVFDRPDNPSKKAIIYDKNGKVLWRNIDKAKVEPFKIKELFKTHNNLKKIFQGY